MIVEEIRTIKSNKNDLRTFGITIGIVLGLLGMWLLWRDKGGSYYLLVGSTAFVALSIIFPLLLKPVHKVWMSLAIILGWVMTRVILIILFYLVVTPTGLLVRLCGKDLLNLTYDKNAKSYWIKRKGVTLDKKRYENQF